MLPFLSRHVTRKGAFLCKLQENKKLQSSYKRLQCCFYCYFRGFPGTRGFPQSPKNGAPTGFFEGLSSKGPTRVLSNILSKLFFTAKEPFFLILEPLCGFSSLLHVVRAFPLFLLSYYNRKQTARSRNNGASISCRSGRSASPLSSSPYK